MNVLIGRAVIFIVATALALEAAAASAQNNSQSERLDVMLNVVDNPVGWSKTPVSGLPPATGVAAGGCQPGTYGYGSRIPQNALSHPFMNQGVQPWAARRTAVPAVQSPPSPWNQLPAQGQAGRPSGALFSRQQIMRTLLGGQSSRQAGGYDQLASGTVYSDWQTAENERSRSYNYSQKARYNKDTWSRKQAASEARYAANSARAASDRACQASMSGDETAKSYAAKARAAADQAQENANRANYNADINQ